jgi:hypothetical protein
MGAVRIVRGNSVGHNKKGAQMVWLGRLILRLFPRKVQFIGIAATAGVSTMDTGTTIVDLRGTLPTNPNEVVYRTRTEGAIIANTWHHTASDTDATLEDIARWQIERLKSEGIVYHLAIQTDRICLLNDFTDITWQAKGCNSKSVGSVMVADLTKYPCPPSIERKAVWLDAYLRRRLPSIREGWMHKQCKSTACPGPYGEFMLKRNGLLNGHP